LCILIHELDVISLPVLNVYLIRTQSRRLVEIVHKVSLPLQYEVEDAFLPQFRRGPACRGFFTRLTTKSLLLARTPRLGEPLTRSRFVDAYPSRTSALILKRTMNSDFACSRSRHMAWTSGIVKLRAFGVRLTLLSVLFGSCNG